MTHQESLTPSETMTIDATTPKTTNETSQAKEQKKARNRCSHTDCRKKLGLMGFSCKCGQTFCVAHQSPHSHKCSYDHGRDKRKDIQSKNPSVIPVKIEVV